jgi:hypothetical protein
MAKLNEYLGSMVASVANARVMSDFQTAKIAGEYANHKLLKHFSIPRMRIEDVEMTIPVALEEVQENIVRILEPIENKKFNAIAYREIVSGLGLKKLPREMSLAIQGKLAKSTQSLERNIRIANSPEPLKSMFRDIITFSLEEAKKNELLDQESFNSISPDKLQLRMEQILSGEIKFKEEKLPFDHLNVIVESHRLRDQSPGSIIYIKLKISESGMEWNRIEHSNGDIEEKLLPE